MPLSEEETEYFAGRTKRLAELKATTKIGIFGSFFESRKNDLLALKNYLLENGYDARISEDLDIRDSASREGLDPLNDLNLSESLIMDSDIHIFVLPARRGKEPEHLIQSVSMEIEHLYISDSYGKKSAKYVIVCVEKGLRVTMGGVCRGLLLKKEQDWIVFEFDEIAEIFQSIRQACLNFILEMSDY
jgi:hypothetical protein